MVANKWIFLISFTFFLSACTNPSPTPSIIAPFSEEPTSQLSSTSPQPTESTAAQTQESIDATPTAAPFEGSYAGLIYRDREGIKRVLENGDRELVLDLEDIDVFSVRLSNDLTKARYHTDEMGYQLFDLQTGQSDQLLNSGPYWICGAHWWEAHPEVILVEILPLDDEGGIACSGSVALKAWQGPILEIVSSSDSWNRNVEGSPDGRFVAFDDDGLPKLYEWERDANWLNLSAFGFPEFDDYYFLRPYWSPSGRWLAWTVSGDLGEENIPGVGIFDLETTTSSFLSPYYVVGSDGGSAHLQWSSDEKHLLLLNSGELFLRMFDVETEAVLYASDDASSGLAGWSPNGDFLAHSERSDSTIIVSSDGSILYKVPLFYGANWSPDSRMLLGRKYENEDDWPGKWYIFDLVTGKLLQTEIPEGVQILAWAAE